MALQGAPQSLHSERSSYREVLIEHLFIGDLLRALWPRRAEVLKPQVDDGGYDLVVEVEGITRHIQLKASKRKAKTAVQKIHRRLEKKPSGCVIWIRFDERDFDLGPFLWFGGSPGEPLPSLSELKTVRHTRGNAAGVKRERPAHRIVPKGRFTPLDGITEVVEHLFGSPRSAPADSEDRP